MVTEHGFDCVCIFPLSTVLGKVVLRAHIVAFCIARGDCISADAHQVFFFFFATTTVVGQGLPVPTSEMSLAFGDLLSP